MEPDVKEEVLEDVKEEILEDVKEEILEDPEISQSSSVQASHLLMSTPVTASEFLDAGANSYSIDENDGIAAKDAEVKLEEEEEDMLGTRLMQLIIL